VRHSHHAHDIPSIARRPITVFIEHSPLFAEPLTS
jgi:hypothetical protein